MKNVGRGCVRGCGGGGGFESAGWCGGDGGKGGFDKLAGRSVRGGGKGGIKSGSGGAGRGSRSGSFRKGKGRLFARRGGVGTNFVYFGQGSKDQWVREWEWE